MQTEGDLVSEKNCYEQKIVEVQNFKQDNRDMRVYYIFHLTDLTDHILMNVQEKIVFEHGDHLIPFSSLDCVAQFVQQFQSSQSKSNPFEQDRGASSKETKIYDTVNSIPGLGDKRTKILMSRSQFSNLRKISNAKHSDLLPVVGDRCAKGMVDFFTKRNTF